MSPCKGEYFNKQAGWILLELTLCLLVIALVSWLMMQQTQHSWSNLNLSKAQRAQWENVQKAQIMQQLTGEDYVSLMESILSAKQQDYPKCLECREQNMRAWFKASLQRGVAPVKETE
ncbi:hypothetical protein [Marinomonas sp. THO17]|uniref:hypothetical protein n=1 Tax=Marinomonas sp. THO17 TaxID=3149048 RepID=UPI00336C0232